MQKSKVKITIKNLKIKIIFSLFATFTFYLLTFTFAHGEIDCQNVSPSGFSASDAQYCADQLTNIMNQYLPAQTTNKKNLAGLQSQLADINKRIAALSAQLKALTVSITKRQEDVAFTQEIFDQKAKEQYTFLRLYDPITPFLSASGATQAFREISFRQRAADADRKTMEGYAKDLTQLRSDEVSLQKSKDALAIAQKQVADKTNFLAAEVAKVDSYLAALSAKQSAFIAAKLESLGLSRSAYNLGGGCSSDINPYKAPNFSGTQYAFFTYGVPNRVGMDQYGAWGRAKDNQSYDQILRAYYNFDDYKDYSGITIKVNNGNGINAGGVIWSGSLEDYVKRIYEVPDSWTNNDSAALKAQAIAARSYVLAATGNGANSICANQYCQVFKTSPKGGNWESAVNATAGKVMIQGGNPIKAWFSATHGGYEYTSADIGWNATSWTKRMVDASGSVNNFSDLANNAFDKDSPVFYCDWGSRKDQNGTAWLSGTDLADIANVLMLVQKDSSLGCFVFQPDQPAPAPDPKEGCPQTANWSPDKVKQELSNRGGNPINAVSDVSIGVDFGTGRTTNVTVNGQNFDGNNFKSYFNQRAPANIQIVGPLYNVEKR